MAGNALTHVLADFGAEVIKVERPGQGDDLRNWRVEGVSIHWKVYARNKKSITLNMRHPRGREVLLDLVRTAQVLVENFVPGTLEKWDLGPEVLHDANPSLVIVRISGWGQVGPDRNRPGFGSLVEAELGRLLGSRGLSSEALWAVVQRLAGCTVASSSRARCCELPHSSHQPTGRTATRE